MVEKTRRIQAVCARYNVPIGAAALQFPFGHPLVSAVIPGPNTPDQVRTNVEWMRVPIPTDLWAELKSEGLIRADAPTPTE
jgi:D-threo-aldose 1-dehydrogenase